MTSAMRATSEAVAQWSRIFTQQATQNYTSSVLFMKQLTVVAVSTVTYLKNAFPEDNYVFEEFGGMKIMTLKHKCNDDLAQFISTSMMQAFDAFEKKYLHQLALCFYDGECRIDNLQEYYLFEYTYKDGGATMSLRTKGGASTTQVSCDMESVRAQTVHLLRACCVSLQAAGRPLPDVCDVSLRLYYNNDTPEDYQAPGFVGVAESEDPLGDISHSLKLGRVETPHHRLALRTYVRDTPDNSLSREAIASQNPPRMTQMEDLTGGVAGSRVRCACNNFDCEDAQPLLLTCFYCGYEQHAACYGVRDDAARAPRHCCVTCATRDPARVPTDTALMQATDKKRECIAIFRRALSLCAGARALSACSLAARLGLSAVSAAKLARLLRQEGILAGSAADDPATPEMVIQDKLQSVMSHYFHNADDTNIVDRLVAETLSQSSQPDPVGETLSPQEKANLQSASQLGRIINPEVNNNVEDITLKQYRKALDGAMDEEMQLSGDPVKDLEKIEKNSKNSKRKCEDTIITGVKTKRARRKASN